LANSPATQKSLFTPRALALGDPDYPPPLHDLKQPPEMLWYIGELSVLSAPCVAIVGTRRATMYGERVTRELAASLARAGACVISGMARGIDGAAHRGALDVGGKTVAVLGTGVDLVYPAAHRALHEKIGTSGLLLSELPPGTHSHGGSFKLRNRIIAALAPLTIVIEAPIQSGALGTADIADELNRDVGIVPGPIDSPQSEGSNRLLRDGAHPIMCPADALTLLGLTSPPVPSSLNLDDPDQASIWRALRDGPADLDTLCHRASLPVQRCLAAVTALELRGAVECALTGEVRKR
jgi:DNA processing protein